MIRTVHGHEVHGVAVGAKTECEHYHSVRDIIAIRLPCCQRYYPCHECHLAVADHPPETWAKHQFGAKAVLCGACGHKLTIEAYLQANHRCPECGSEFNPGCSGHHHLYFESD